MKKTYIENFTLEDANKYLNELTEKHLAFVEEQCNQPNLIYKREEDICDDLYEYGGRAIYKGIKLYTNIRVDIVNLFFNKSPEMNTIKRNLQHNYEWSCLFNNFRDSVENRMKTIVCKILDIDINKVGRFIEMPDSDTPYHKFEIFVKDEVIGCTCGIWNESSFQHLKEIFSDYTFVDDNGNPTDNFENVCKQGWYYHLKKIEPIQK